jgi:hypothetical protein
MPKLSDERIKAICHAEIQSSTGWQSGELAEDRAQAMDYYLGQPYGDEREGESKVVTREVLDTVEWILPSMMRLFTDTDNAVEFTPVGPEDEPQAEQETDTITHVCWQQNDGFLNLYTAIKDALLSKNGVLKVYWDDNPNETREEYQGLNDIELSTLITDKTVEKDVIEYETNEDGTHNITLKVRTPGKIRVMPCPPEEIGVNRDARSPNIQECTWVHHRVRKTKSELIEEGYDQELIKSIPSDDDVNTQERLSRRNLDDEQDYLSPDEHWSRHTVWVTECYIKIDRDDDGIAELLQVTLAAGSSDADTGSTLLGIEEVDVIPFVSFSPVLLTHKYYGLSVADLVMDVQRIKSELLRGALTNMYLANNQRVHINERVNLDDLLTPRPGGIVRHEGQFSPGENFVPHPHQPVPQQNFDLLSYMDEERKDRVGVSDMTAGLDSQSLANVNTGVLMQAFDASHMKIELFARICAEVMLRPMYRMVHMLLRKHQEKPMVIRLRNQFVEVNPTTWRERYDMEVKVGLGQASRERRLVALEKIMSAQAQASQLGAPVVMPQQAYETLIDYTEALGIKNAEKYWQNPALIPPAPPQPDPQMEALKLQGQAMVMDAQAAQQKNQVEMAKIQSQERLRVAELQSKQQEMALKGQIEDMKAQLTVLKTGVDSQNQGSKQAADEQKAFLEANIRGMELMLQKHNTDSKAEIDQYKAELQSYTQLQQQYMTMAAQQANNVAAQAQQVDDSAGRAAGDMAALVSQMEKMVLETRSNLEQLNAPKRRVIRRNENGEAVGIDEMEIIRENGVIVGVQ